MKESQATISFTCPNARQGSLLLDRLARTPRVSVTLLRGRITAGDARYRVSLQGAPRAVDRALARISDAV